MNTIRTHAHWPGGIRPLLWLLLLVPILLSGCRSQPANFTMVKTTSTNMTVVVSPDSTFIAHPTPLTVTLPNPISISITNAGKEPTCCNCYEHKGSCCQAVPANCEPPHCGAGGKPITESDAKLTPSNLLALLALLVALSAYLANVRRGLIPKRKMEREKAKELVAAKLELAKRKDQAATSTPVDKQEGEVTRLEAELEQAELPDTDKLNEIAWGLFWMSIADALFIVATVLLGTYILQQTVTHCPAWSWAKPAALRSAAAGVLVLIGLHFVQITKSIVFWWKNKKP